jgi:hypothetical protein
MSVEVTSLGVQVHGGMGFIEETGAAQHYRDARILTIYEGTTAIQANDLVGRKTYRDKGLVAKSIAKLIQQTEAELAKSKSPAAQSVLKHLSAGRVAFETVVDYVIANFKTNPQAVFAGSVPYLRLCGLVLSGWQMARALLVAEQKLAEDSNFYSSKIATARFHAEHLLSQAPGIASTILEGGDSVIGLNVENF